MGCELAQVSEWSHDRSIDWHLLDYPEHRGTQDLIRQLNNVYRDTPALYEQDSTDAGFRWIDASDVDQNVLSFMRLSKDGSQKLVCVANLSPMPRYGYRIGVPHGGGWREVLNTDATEFGGSGVGNMGWAVTRDESWHGLPAVIEVTLPPMAVVWFAPE
jgi:1,4-alpha-glucan branching enzyme